MTSFMMRGGGRHRPGEQWLIAPVRESSGARCRITEHTPTPGPAYDERSTVSGLCVCDAHGIVKENAHRRRQGELARNAHGGGAGPSRWREPVALRRIRRASFMRQLCAGTLAIGIVHRDGLHGGVRAGMVRAKRARANGLGDVPILDHGAYDECSAKTSCVPGVAREGRPDRRNFAHRSATMSAGTMNASKAMGRQGGQPRQASRLSSQSAQARRERAAMMRWQVTPRDVVAPLARAVCANSACRNPLQYSSNLGVAGTDQIESRPSKR